MEMNRCGFALALLIGVLTFLSSPPQTEAAVASPALRPAVADLLDQGIVESVHYSRRYGWHCGMWERYGHGHPEYCYRRGAYPRGWGGGWGSQRHHWDHDGDGDRDGDKRDHHGDRNHDGGKGNRDHDRDRDRD